METAGASVDTAHHLVALCWLYVINVLWFKDAAVSRMHHLKCLRAPCWTCGSLSFSPKPSFSWKLCTAESQENYVNWS